MARIGLVLGAGGAVGHAFHAGVLDALAETTGWDARDADLVVGTSAGSIVGTLLRAGLSPADLAARSTDAAMSPGGADLIARVEEAHADQPPIPDRPERGRFPGRPKARLVLGAATPPFRVRPGSLVASLMPRGRISTEVVAAGLRVLHDEWPEHPLWINAVDLHSGQRVTFGRDGHPPVDVATAVAASCAIPSFFTPVAVNGSRYVDGGVHSPTNADVVIGARLDLVVVIAPMSMARAIPRLTPDQPVRHASRIALIREARRIRRAGIPVLTFQPTDADRAAMGLKAMDASRRHDVTHQARESARQRLELAEARDRAALLAKAARPRA